MNRGARALIGTVAVGALLVALAGAARVLSAPVSDPHEAAARSLARHRAATLDAELTRAVADAGDAPPWQLTAALEDVLERTGSTLGAYEPFASGEADAAWRLQVVGAAGGGFFADYVEAVLCVDVTIRRHATPPVRMVDSECPAESVVYADHVVYIDLPE